MEESALEELEARLDAADSKDERTHALNALAWALRAEQPKRAHELASEARVLAQASGDVGAQAQAARTMAMTIRDVEQLSDVFHLAQEAKTLFDQVEDPLGQAAARDFLASIREYIGDYTGALELALDALRIARSVGDPVRQGYALSNVGGVLAASGDVEAGVQRLQEALLLFEEAKRPDGTAAITSRLSRVLQRAGRNEEARGFAERCVVLAEERNDEWLLGDALSVLAELERAAGRSEAAEALLLRALEGAEEAPASVILGSELLVSLGRLLMEQGRWAEAQERLEDAVRRVEGEPISVMWAAAAHEALSELHEEEGRFEQALFHVRQAQELRREMVQKEARSARAQVEMRAAMEAAEKEAELQRARYEELRAMQAKLLESEKMALLGKLAAGTAHELNSPLGVMQSSLDVLHGGWRRRFDAQAAASEVDGRVQPAVEAAYQTGRAALERLRRIVESYRRFTQLDAAEHQRFDLLEGLESAISLTEPNLPPDVRIERRLEPLPRLLGWPRELNHAFLTVLQNAADAVGDAGRIQVRASRAAAEVRIEIEDDGRGMSEGLVRELFSLDVGREGPRAKMRLGLPAAKAAAERHGGRIEVDSELGKGTCICFALPVEAQGVSDF